MLIAMRQECVSEHPTLSVISVNAPSPPFFSLVISLLTPTYFLVLFKSVTMSTIHVIPGVKVLGK